MVSAGSVIFDAVMLLLIVAMAVIGKKTGLVRMLFLLAVVFIAALTARIAAPPVNALLTNMKLGDSIKSSVNGKLLEWVEEDSELDFEGAVKKLGLSEEIAKAAEGSVKGIRQEKGEALAEKLSGFIANATVKLVSYVTVALIVIILLAVISAATKLVNKLPVVGTFNAAGGIIAGLLAGAGAVFLICMFVSSIGLGRTSGFIAEIANKSFFIKIIGKTGITGGIIK